LLPFSQGALLCAHDTERRPSALGEQLAKGGADSAQGYREARQRVDDTLRTIAQIADTVNTRDMPAAALQSDDPSALEKEAINNGLTIVPFQTAAGASSLVNKGLTEDGRWESKAGLRLVSSSRPERQSHPSSVLSRRTRWELKAGIRPVSSGGIKPYSTEFFGSERQSHSSSMLSLLKREEQQGNSWERKHGMIPFTSHQQEHLRFYVMERPGSGHAAEGTLTRRALALGLGLLPSSSPRAEVLEDDPCSSQHQWGDFCKNREAEKDEWETYVPTP
jgi:hypothetical protein